MPRRLALLTAALAVLLAPPAQATTIKGRLKVVHVDPATPAAPGSYRYFIRERELRFPDRPALASGQRVRVEGSQRDGVLRVEDADALAAAEALEPVSGTDDVLVLPITETVPDETTIAHMQARMSEAATFFARSSYGAYGQRPRVSPWLKVPPQPEGCALWDYTAAAEEAARAQGIEPDAYERLVVYLGPGIDDCYAGGYAYVRARNAWIVGGSFTRYVATHELGHTVGLHHSHALRCHDRTGAEVVFGTRCEPFDEYGDVFDTMGSIPADFNAVQKDVLGWMTGRTTAVPAPVTAPRTVSLTPMSASSGLKALRIGSTPVWVEYRRPTGNDAALAEWGIPTDGVLLHVPQPSFGGTLNGSNLLDGRPTGDGSFYDAPLPAGARFDDPLGAFSLKVNSIGSTASVSVTPSAVAGAAYAYAARPTTASYAPAVQGSTHGGQVTVQRPRPGEYSVLLRRVGFPGGVAHVTAVGTGGESCVVRQTRIVGADALVHLDCFAGQAHADAAFTISWTKQVGTAAPFAHVVADQPRTASYAPAGAFTSTGGAATVTRLSAGSYVVRLGGLAEGGAGTVQLTPLAGSAATCQVAAWRPDAGDMTVDVRCSNLSGARMDVPFALTYARGTGLLGPSERPAGYAFADQPTAASYTARPAFSHNSTGGATTVTRSAAGTYAVRFAGLAAATTKGGVAQVTARGSDGSRCKLAGYGTSGADRVVDVVCRTAAGVKADRPFTVGWSA